MRGNHDEEGGLDALPRDVLVRVGDVRIGLTHGHRTAAVEFPAAALSLLARAAPCLLGFGAGDAAPVRLRQLPGDGASAPADPRAGSGGVLHFSPGAVFVPESDPHYDWSGRGGAATAASAGAAGRGARARRRDHRGGRGGGQRAPDPAGASGDRGRSVTAAAPPPPLHRRASPSSRRSSAAAACPIWRPTTGRASASCGGGAPGRGRLARPRHPRCRARRPLVDRHPRRRGDTGARRGAELPAGRSGRPRPLPPPGASGARGALDTTASVGRPGDAAAARGAALPLAGE